MACFWSLELIRALGGTHVTLAPGPDLPGPALRPHPVAVTDHRTKRQSRR